MSYIGNTPTQQNFVAGADQFSGNGSTVAFTLSRSVNTVFDIFVTVSNVPQDPFTAYTVAGNTLTFDGAPPSGTNNIDVVYRATNVQTFVPTPGVSTQLGLGSAAAPSLTFIGDTNTGIYSPAADTVAIGTGGTERLRVDSAGNAGLGATPNAWGASWKSMSFNTVGAVASTTGVTRLYHNAFNNDSNNLYRTTAAASMYSQDGAHAWFIAPSGTAGNAITFTQAMTLDASGRLIVGTTTAPSSTDVKLFVNSSGGGFAGFAANGTAGSAVGSPTTSTLAFYTAAGTLGSEAYTERARITSGGYFKATSTGTYSAGTTGGVHEFDTSAVDGTIVNFYNQAASNPNGIYVGYTAADPNDATRYVFGAQQNTGVWIYRIYSNGTVAARSDAKWKKNIETTRDGYAEDLAKLRVVKYNWYNHEDGTPKELGLIAQEVEQVFPGLVATDEQTLNEIKTREIPAVLDEEGNEVEPARTEEYTEKVGTGEYSKSIKFSVLPIMLLKAIQEQQAMIDEMKAEIAALKAQP